MAIPVLLLVQSPRNALRSHQPPAVQFGRGPVWCPSSSRRQPTALSDRALPRGARRIAAHAVAWRVMRRFACDYRCAATPALDAFASGGLAHRRLLPIGRDRVAEHDATLSVPKSPCRVANQDSWRPPLAPSCGQSARQSSDSCETSWRELPAVTRHDKYRGQRQRTGHQLSEAQGSGHRCSDG